jgi:hypothetical protein
MRSVITTISGHQRGGEKERDRQTESNLDRKGEQEN